MNNEDIDRIIAEALEKDRPSGKRQWHRPSRKKEHIRQARTVLNTVFMLGFVAAIAIYFLLPESRTLFFCVGFGAVLLKIVEFILRFMF